jgi:hypothetical protein
VHSSIAVVQRATEEVHDLIAEVQRSIATMQRLVAPVQCLAAPIPDRADPAHRLGSSKGSEEEGVHGATQQVRRGVDRLRGGRG